MELTEGQRRVVDHGRGVVRVAGGAGTGRTTALTARYLRLVREHLPSSVLVLCRSRGAATRFRDAVLPRLSGGFDSLPITTLAGLAFDVVTRGDGPLRLVTGPEQRRTVARLLADEDSSAWPTLGHLLHRQALVAEVADGLLLLQHRPPEAGAHRDAAWAELQRFLPRYRRALADLGGTDMAGLLRRAADLLGGGGGGDGGGGGSDDRRRFAHVLVDDVEPAGESDRRILQLLAVAADDLVVVGDLGGIEPTAGVDLGQ
ncbi:MAG: hypothetical protein QOJ69_1222, partial [Actinomycetota bacterium]|nr:hypothetical protein [Actinomycetota bacterium]